MCIAFGTIHGFWGAWNASPVDNGDYFTGVRTSAYEFGVGHNSAHNKHQYDANISFLTINNQRAGGAPGFSEAGHCIFQVRPT